MTTVLVPKPITNTTGTIIPFGGNLHSSIIMNSKNNESSTPSLTKSNHKKAMKMLQITNRFRKSSSKSLSSSTTTTSTDNYDYIVEFEQHFHHQLHGNIPNGTLSTNTSIPPFRIIPPSPETTSSTTEVLENLKSSTRCCTGSDHDRSAPRGFRIFRKASGNSSLQTLQRRMLPRKRRIRPTRNTTVSQSTLQTLHTSSSSTSSTSGGVESDPMNEPTGPINEYGDCRMDDEWNMVVSTSCSSTTTAMSTAQMMMDISDQYYCIGKYYQYELCQSQLALQYYYNAYHTAIQCYRNLMSSSTTFSTSAATAATTKSVSTDEGATGASSPTVPALLLEEIQGQIQLTKECIGRIHFELGNIDEALQML